MPCVSYPLAPPTDFPKWNDIIGRHEPIVEEPRREPDDCAFIIYTSGSTGRPKGAVHTFASISASTYAIVKALGITASDRAISYLPLAHAMDRWLSECASLVTGYRIYFAESLETFVQDVKRAKPTLFVSVPRLWLKFQRGVFAKLPEEKLAHMLRIPIVAGVVRKKILKNLGLDQVRFAGSGSAPIAPELLGWYRDLGIEMLEGYGMTENLALSHITEPGKNQQGTVGPVYEGVQHRLDPQTGEVQMLSQALMMGYYKEPEKGRECFTDDGWLKTGDKGSIDAQGLHGCLDCGRGTAGDLH